MSTALAGEVRWESADNEWAHYEILYRGEVSPGRIVDWGNSQGYANIAVVLGDGEETDFRRVVTLPTVDAAKRVLLAIADSEEVDGNHAQHDCAEYSKRRELYKLVHNERIPDIAIRRRWGIWSAMRGVVCLLTDLTFCPYCGERLP